MNMAITDRTGPDDSPLTIHVDRSHETNYLAILGLIGTLVCAQGKDGWAYIGAVTSIDYAAGTYTILPVAVQQPGVGPAWPPSTRREK